MATPILLKGDCRLAAGLVAALAQDGTDRAHHCFPKKQASPCCVTCRVRKFLPLGLQLAPIYSQNSRCKPSAQNSNSRRIWTSSLDPCAQLQGQRSDCRTCSVGVGVHTLAAPPPLIKKPCVCGGRGGNRWQALGAQATERGGTRSQAAMHRQSCQDSQKHQRPTSKLQTSRPQGSAEGNFWLGGLFVLDARFSQRLCRVCLRFGLGFEFRKPGASWVFVRSTQINKIPGLPPTMR